MFSLFSTPIYAPQEPTFTPLFRLLDDFDNYSREVEQTQCRPQAVSCPARRVHRHPQATRALNTTTAATFKPKFDVRETETTYELHGELPGIGRDNLHIEFTDPQTLVVRGRVERTYETKPEEEETEKTETDTLPNPEPEATPSEAGSTGSNSHHATVEDAPEDEDEDWEKATTTSVASATATPAVTETPKTEVAKPVEKTAEVQKAAPAQKAQRYWLYERSIGEFSRTFNFPARVEQEGVSATLDNGVLNVTVPKAKRHQARRIAIF